jgi:inorganic triphosphatase YgiF
MSETELKFGIVATSVPDIDRAMIRHGARLIGIESRYWDTPDLRLARAGLSLRLRKSRGRWEQTVKAAGPSPAERLEETVSRPAAVAGAEPQPDLSLHAGTRAGRLLARALDGSKDAAALELVHTTRVRRRLLVVALHGSEIEVAFDRGQVEAGGRSLPVCEIEAELKHGDAIDLIEFGRQSIDAHALWLSTASKAARGNQLARGSSDSLPALKSRRPEFRDDAAGSEIFRAAFLSCLDQVLANASNIASGCLDDEVVHQLRIGLRRMRTVWREMPDWRGDLATSWLQPAADVFRELGVDRDRRTVAAALREPLLEAGSPDPDLRAPRGAQPVDVVELVRSKDFQHALLDMLDFALAQPSGSVGDDDDRPPGAFAGTPRATIARRLDKLHRRLARDAKRFAELSSVERHGVRKRLKRLRYSTELVAPLFGKRAVARFLQALDPGQDELGRYMDLLVAGRLARDLAEAGDGRAWFNVGWLQAREAGAIRRCSVALREVAEASAYWDR